MTNGDRIRQMTDEELATRLCKENDCPTCAAYDLCDHVKEDGYLKWMKQEVTDD